MAFQKNNNVSQEGVEKLYLDSETADLNFIIKVDAKHTENVPAHKNILSVGSPVFKAMFYGPIKEKGDVKIVDASLDAFKEFLQFFYLGKVRLTSENIIGVTKLCHKYEVADALKLCESVLQAVLTINDMCSGYELARLLDLKSTIMFCEQHIKKNPEGILKSDDFPKCDSKTLDKILEMVSSIQSNQCSPSTIVDASMAWAKAECVRNGLQGTPAELRAQLNESFHRIPFAEMNNEQFSQHFSSYKRFFNEDDLESIIMQATSKKAKTIETIEKISFNLRGDSGVYVTYSPSERNLTISARLWLKEIHFTKLLRDTFPGKYYNVNAAITLRKRKDDQPLLLGNVNLSSTGETKLLLPIPLVINSCEEHVLKIDCERTVAWAEFSDTSIFKQNDVEINISPNAGPISVLVFERPSA